MSPEADRARERALSALARADSADLRARRFDRLAQEGPPSMRSMYDELAALQRRTGERHRASARIHAEYARRIDASRRRPHDPEMVARLVDAVADALGIESAALLLWSFRHGDLAAVTSDGRARDVIDAELTLEEGPSKYVTRTCRHVGVGAAELAVRWPRFASAVEPLALRSVAAVPLKLGDSAIGSLTVLDAPWSSPAQGLADLMVVGEAIMDTVLEDLGSDPESLDRAPVLRGDWMPIVHRAAGMLSARLGCSPRDSVALIQAHAFAEGRATLQVAHDITEGLLDLAD